MAGWEIESRIFASCTLRVSAKLACPSGAAGATIACCCSIENLPSQLQYRRRGVVALSASVFWERVRPAHRLPRYVVGTSIQLCKFLQLSPARMMSVRPSVSLCVRQLCKIHHHYIRELSGSVVIRVMLMCLASEVESGTECAIASSKRSAAGKKSMAWLRYVVCST